MSATTPTNPFFFGDKIWIHDLLSFTIQSCDKFLRQTRPSHLAVLVCCRSSAPACADRSHKNRTIPAMFEPRFSWHRHKHGPRIRNDSTSYLYGARRSRDERHIMQDQSHRPSPDDYAFVAALILLSVPTDRGRWKSSCLCVPHFWTRRGQRRTYPFFHSD